jgi:hypothetical protein
MSDNLQVRAMLIAVLLAGCVDPLPLQADGVVSGKPVMGHCTPQTCSGCCRDDVCLGGNFDEACGYDGRTCESCAAGFRCDVPGACYPERTPWDAGTQVPPLQDAGQIPTERHGPKCHLLPGWNALFCE